MNGAGAASQSGRIEGLGGYPWARRRVLEPARSIGAVAVQRSASPATELSIPRGNFLEAKRKRVIMLAATGHEILAQRQRL